MRAAQVIGLDGRNLGLERGTGVSTYATVLAGCLDMAGLSTEILDAAPSRTRGRRWAAAAFAGSAGSLVSVPGRRSAPDVFRVAQVHFDLWRRLRVVRGATLPDIMHWTYPLPLRLAGRPNVYTVHDLIPLLHPTLSAIDGARLRRILACIIRSAAHIITVSDATRQEIIRELRVPADFVTNTGQAVNVDDIDPAPPEGLAPGAYWLHVGTVEPRKNVGRLIAAWRTSRSAYPLVLAGPDGWNAARELEQAAGIMRLPWLARPQLLALVRDARALLMPSLAEGFGLPVAEAMTLGTPVITSNRGALAEVAGRGGLLVDPEDVHAIAAGLRALEPCGGLRATMADSGRAEAKRFERAAYAGRLAAVYDRVVRAAPRAP